MPKRKKSSLSSSTAKARRVRLRRKRETSAEREYRLSKDRARYAARRQCETASEREYRLARNKINICLTMPTRKKSSLARSTTSAIRSRLRRQQETSTEREYRLSKDRVRAAFRRHYETAEEREKRLAADRARHASQREGQQRKFRLFWDKVRREIEAQSAPSCVLEQTESVLPDVPVVPNLDIVKKEPIDYTEEIIPSESQSMPSVQSLSSCTLSVKLEPPDDCVDDITVPVNPDDITNTVENSPMFTSHTCLYNTEPPPIRPNLSLSPSTSNIEIKDEFSIFGDFVAAKVRNFTDRRLQIEAQHRITNMLFEMENLNEDSLPVISKISSFPKPLPASVTLPSNLNIGHNSSLQTELPSTVVLPPSSALNKNPSLQTQIPVTVPLPSSSAIRILSLHTPLPETMTLPSSSAVSRISSLQTQFPANVTLPSNSGICGNSILQAPSPGTVTPPSNSAMNRITIPQTELYATVASSSSSDIGENPSLQAPLPATVTLPFSSSLSRNSSFHKHNSPQH